MFESLFFAGLRSDAAGPMHEHVEWYIEFE